MADLAVLVFRIEETVDGLAFRPASDVHIDSGVVIVEVDPQNKLLSVRCRTTRIEQLAYTIRPTGDIIENELNVDPPTCGFPI